MVFPFILSLNLFNAINGYTQKASSIDVYRSQYMQLEAELWSIVENGVDQASVLNHVLRQHKAFANSNLTTQIPNENDFFLFESIFEWKTLKDDLMPIRSLYDSFLPILERNAQNINSLELNDFAETTLAESDQINRTIESMDNLMVKQGTYYKVMLVCEFYHCFTIFFSFQNKF